MNFKQFLVQKWWLVSAVILAGTIVLILSSLAGTPDGTLQPTPTPVETETPVSSAPPVIMAEGIVIPSQSVSLHFPNGGIIEEVLVSEGEHISAGQVIARQKGQTHLQAAVSSAQLQLLAAQQDYDKLLQRAPLQTGEAKLSLVIAQKSYDDALENRYDADFSKADANHIDMAYAAYLLALEKYEGAQKEYEAYQNFATDDEERAEKTVLLEQARNHHDQALAVWNYALSTADNEESNELDAYLDLAGAEMHTAETDWQKHIDGANIDEKALAEARLQHAQAVFDQSVASQKDLVMKAPFEGEIASNSLRIGEYAGPETNAVELGDMQWRVETTDLNELDISRIYPDMPASITLDALPELNLQGHVSNIEKAGIASGSDIYYTVTIDLQQSNELMYWNMTAFIRFGS